MFSEDAVIDSISHWASILCVTAFGSELSCPVIVSFSSLLSRYSLFHPLQPDLLTLFLTRFLSLLFSLYISCPHGSPSAYDKQMLTMQICLFLQSLHPLSRAKQIHRNSALFPVTYFSIHAVFFYYISVNIQYIKLSGRLISFTWWYV